MTDTRMVATQSRLVLPWPADTSALATTEVTNILQQHGMLTALALGYPLKSWHEPASQPPTLILWELQRELAQHIDFALNCLHVVRAAGRIVEVNGVLRKPQDPPALIFMLKPQGWKELIKTYYRLLNWWYNAMMCGGSGELLQRVREFRSQLIESAPQAKITIAELGLWLDHTDSIIDWLLR